MKLFLGPEISQMFWRLVYPLDRKPCWPAPVEGVGECACRAAEVRELLPSWVDACLEQSGALLDVLSFDSSRRRATASTVARVWGTEVPEGSFFEFGNGVVVPSPCFTFLLMAKQLSLPELVAYGDELCGLYAFDKKSPRGMRQREVPLVSLSELGRYLNGANGSPGLRLARKALPLIVEGSASPMETVDVMLLCLPVRHGGYGLPVADMNLEVPLGRLAASIANKQTCRGDLCWLDEHLIVEHQGLYDHDNSNAYSSDRARIDALKAEGYNVLELTSSIVHDLNAFEGIALFVARVFGKRVRSSCRGRLPQRIELRKSLFAWNERSGLPR